MPKDTSIPDRVTAAIYVTDLENMDVNQLTSSLYAIPLQDFQAEECCIILLHPNLHSHIRNTCADRLYSMHSYHREYHKSGAERLVHHGVSSEIKTAKSLFQSFQTAGHSQCQPYIFSSGLGSAWAQCAICRRLVC